MRAALPTNESWNVFNNAYDHTAYQAICNEFGVDPQKVTGEPLEAPNGWPTAVGVTWTVLDSTFRVI